MAYAVEMLSDAELGMLDVHVLTWKNSGSRPLLSFGAAPKPREEEVMTKLLRAHNKLL